MKYKTDIYSLVRQIGYADPMLNDGRKAPDERRVSLRWLFGSVTIGAAACMLMGGALYIALDGQQQLSQPAQIIKEIFSFDNKAIKGDRLIPITARQAASEKIIKVPISTQILGRSVISKKPFALISAPLAIVPTQKIEYAEFDPLKMFLPNENTTTVSTDILYDANVDSEVTITYSDFSNDIFNTNNDVTDYDAKLLANQFYHQTPNENVAKELAQSTLTAYGVAQNELNIGAISQSNDIHDPFFSNPEVAIEEIKNENSINEQKVFENEYSDLTYTISFDGDQYDQNIIDNVNHEYMYPDPTGEVAIPIVVEHEYSKLLETSEHGFLMSNQIGYSQQDEVNVEEVLQLQSQYRIVIENETYAEKSKVGRRFSEDVLVVSGEQTITTMLESLNPKRQNMKLITDKLEELVGFKNAEAGIRIRVAWEKNGAFDPIEIRRVGVYSSGGTHFGSVAVNDAGDIVNAEEPVTIAATRAAQDEKGISTLASAQLPTVYDGIFRAAMSRGLSEHHATRIVRTLASDADFKAVIKPNDKLEVFMSLNDENKPDVNSEILYIALTLGGKERRYYRFIDPENENITYYNDDGASAKKFILRRPVPTGRFNSPYGMRDHPILKRRLMHHGVDFAAPTGTPIIAAGDGIVTRARWAGGYGRHIIIKHANGYQTSYGHLYRYAPGIKAGTKVKQGQVIGHVGSSGQSTGPNLHYEIHVNRKSVNPMEIRLPNEKNLNGEYLIRFQDEKKRIDNLIGNDTNDTDATLASL